MGYEFRKISNDMVLLEAIDFFRTIHKKHKKKKFSSEIIWDLRKTC